MQRYHRWLFGLAGCAVVVNALQRLLQAEDSALLTLFTAPGWFWFAYHPPQFRSRVWQWVLYLLTVSAVILIASSVYDLLA